MSQSGVEHIVNKAIALEPHLTPTSLQAYLHEILSWNSRLGLVSRRDPLRACERLLLESLELLSLVRTTVARSPVRCADVGSGAGFPGVVWALAEPDWPFLLIERKTGMATFLEVLTARLSLDHVEVFAGSIEEAARSERLMGAFDVAVAVAVAPPETIGPLIEPLLRDVGWYFGTLPANASPPFRVGETLVLVGNTPGMYGNYAAYHAGGA